MNETHDYAALKAKLISGNFYVLDDAEKVAILDALEAAQQVQTMSKALKETVAAEARMNSMVGTPYFAQECLEYAARKAKEALSAIEDAK